jgi:pilus assembly protein FimV
MAAGVATAAAAAAASAAEPAALDLDLDLTSPGSAMETTQSLEPKPAADSGLMDLELPEIDTAPAAPEKAARGDFDMDLDLSGVSLDLEPPAAPQARASESSSEPDSDYVDLDVTQVDPMERKLELAEEFRQIGDSEGARDLLQEVIARASGPMKARAQALLDELT